MSSLLDSTSYEESLYFNLTCDLFVPVSLRVEQLRGLTPAHATSTEALSVVAQLSSGGESLTVPMHTPYCCASASTHTWNAWLSFPVKYRDLAADTALCLTLYRRAAAEKPSVVGGASLQLFSKKGRLRTGPQTLRLWRGFPASLASPSATPGKLPLAQRGQFGQLELLMKRYQRGEVTHVPWLDRLALAQITMIQSQEQKGESGALFLDLTLPAFERMVLHCWQAPALAVAPAPLSASAKQEARSGEAASRLVPIIDPEVGKDSPAELKAQKMARSGARGLADRNLKPDTDERRRIAAILMQPSSRPLTAEERGLVWRFRWSLTGEARALTAVLQCVDWGDAREAHQAVALMQAWAPISLADALELLSPAFTSAEVRAHAVDVLLRTDDDALLSFLLQLVQALRYEPDTNSRLADFLVARGVANPTLGVFLHWYLYVEWEDPTFGARAAEVHKKLQEALTEALAGKKNETLLVISNQMALVAQLRHLVSQLQIQNARFATQKTERLRELVAETGSCSELNHLNCPLPLDPSITLLGLNARHCSVFRSALAPLLLTFKTQRPAGQQGVYRVIYKRGDDLRQDQLVVQMFSLMDQLFKRENLDLRLTPYRVLPTSPEDGLIECVASTSLADVIKDHKSVRGFLVQHCPDSSGPMGLRQEALDNYIKSCAGYSVMTYVLGVGDRHLDNLMLCPDGRLFHIDFGFIMGRDPKPWAPPLKLSKEMVDGMGGHNSHEYHRFRGYACEAYNILRKSAPLIMSLFHLMAGAAIPDICSDPEKAMLKLQEKLRLDLDDEGGVEWMQHIINDSVTAFMPVIIETTHRWAQTFR